MRRAERSQDTGYLCKLCNSICHESMEASMHFLMLTGTNLAICPKNFFDPDTSYCFLVMKAYVISSVTASWLIMVVLSGPWMFGVLIKDWKEGVELRLETSVLISRFTGTTWGRQNTESFRAVRTFLLKPEAKSSLELHQKCQVYMVYSKSRGSCF